MQETVTKCKILYSSKECVDELQILLYEEPSAQTLFGKTTWTPRLISNENYTQISIFSKVQDAKRKYMRVQRGRKKRQTPCNFEVFFPLFCVAGGLQSKPAKVGRAA